MINTNHRKAINFPVCSYSDGKSHAVIRRPEGKFPDMKMLYGGDDTARHWLVCWCQTFGIANEIATALNESNIVLCAAERE